MPRWLAAAGGLKGAAACLGGPLAPRHPLREPAMMICVLRGPPPPPPFSQVVVAESFGGRDEPVDALREALVSSGLELALDPLRVKETPTEALYQVGGGGPAVAGTL